MIRDLDATLSAWLSAVAPFASISFEPAASAAGSPAGDRPTLTLALVEVQEDQAAGTLSWSTRRNDEGRVVGRMPPTRRYRFTYLVAAVAADTGAEHATLGSVLVGLAADDVVPEEHLRGVLADCAHELVVRCAPQRPEPGGRERWSSWQLAGGRTALELEVLAPLPAAALQDVAEPPSHLELHGSPRYSPPGSLGGAPDDAAGPPVQRRPTARISEP